MPKVIENNGFGRIQSNISHIRLGMVTYRLTHSTARRKVAYRVILANTPEPQLHEGLHVDLSGLCMDLPERSCNSVAR